uniref:Transposable element P transposase-like RNase H domain-containing protein n=1 Tax=Magallana gigas TaxID=29159 RepID=A0A8W8MHY1_MAGGI
MVDKADISSPLPGKNGPSKSKSYKNEETFERKKNLKRSQNIDIEDEMVDKQCDDSLHIDEIPVKEYDVDNISTLWPALSGAVDVSTARTRHLSSISTKSDKSNCSDLSAIFSPIKAVKNMEGEDEKTERLPVKRQWIQAHYRKLTNFKPAKKEHRDTLCSSKTRPRKYNQSAGTMGKLVTITDDLEVTVRFGEVVVQGFENSVEKMRVNKFLEAVDKITKCAGIKDSPDVTIKRGVQGNALCGPCSKLETSLNSQENASPNMLHPKTPLKHVPQTTLIKHFKVIREENRKLQSLVDSLSRGETASVADDVGEGLFATLQSCKSGNALMDLFWEEQKKAFTTSPKGMRWHPMMIRFAIYLRCQSPRAYESLRESGVLRLPNQATLRDYTNFIQPKSGFQAEAFQELKKVAKDLPSEKKYVCLLHDEMKVKSDLVYDRRSDLINQRQSVSESEALQAAQNRE